MSWIKKSVHHALVPVGRVLSRLLPDKVPATFVGPESSRELCESIAHTGVKQILIVTDAGLVACGLVDRITEALGACGLGVSIYAGVEPDPTFEHADAGLARFDECGCDAVLALGGGSSIDASKLIAAMVTNRVPVAKLEGAMKVRHAPAPLYVIPTTAGTGSEVTLAAVLSDPVDHAKKFFIDPKLLPLMTALDPCLMTGLPPAITAATGMDALTHAIESYVSRNANAATRDYASISVRLVFEHLPVAYARGDLLESRKAMALASYYGGLAFTRTSVGYVHAIAHTFGACYGTPHGLANAIALPHVLEFSKSHAQERLAELARLIGIDEGPESALAEGFIEAVRSLMTKIDIPHQLAALEARDVPSIARQALAEAHLNYPVPRYMSQPECEQLLGRMLVVRDATA